jgi:hypothetical protein
MESLDIKNVQENTNDRQSSIVVKVYPVILAFICHSSANICAASLSKIVITKCHSGIDEAFYVGPTSISRSIDFVLWIYPKLLQLVFCVLINIGIVAYPDAGSVIRNRTVDIP